MAFQTISPVGALADLHHYLAVVEAARQRQFDALPDNSLDVVAAAHRTTVEKILNEVREARRRLAEGLYGVCAGCNQRIAPERLEARPWATSCTGCTGH